LKRSLACLALLMAVAAAVPAQVAVQANANHEQLLASPDARIAANKRLVYDFWREVFEAGHLELADKYMAELSYIQHNPNGPPAARPSSSSSRASPSRRPSNRA
jgi:hypothetical protein